MNENKNASFKAYQNYICFGANWSMYNGYIPNL